MWKIGVIKMKLLKFHCVWNLSESCFSLQAGEIQCKLTPDELAKSIKDAKLQLADVLNYQQDFVINLPKNKVEFKKTYPEQFSTVVLYLDKVYTG